MTIYNKLTVAMNMPLSDSVGGLKITVVDFSYILIEGHKGIIKYALNEIAIKTKKGSLTLIGENLTLKEINEDEILVKGYIKTLSRQE